MQAQALEHSLDFEAMTRYATPHVGERWPITHWLVHSICHLMGTLSIYDYAARVHMAKEMLDNVNPSHISAARMTLEQIIVNLAPRPETVEAATHGVGAAALVSTENALEPLDDEPILDERLPALRREVLARAFSVYCEVGVDALLQDMDDEEPPRFADDHDSLMARVEEEAGKLAEARQAAYADFPSEARRSVSDMVIADRKSKYGIRDKLGGTTKLSRLIAEIERGETQIRHSLQETLSRAKRVRSRLEQMEKRYRLALRNLEYFKGAVAGSLDEETLERAEERLASLEKSISARFDPEQHLPEDILEDLRKGRSLYRDGEL